MGDALGFLREGYPPDECEEFVKIWLSKPDKVKQIARFGQYTDDTQLARELLQSYIKCKRFSPADYAKRIAAIFKENRIVGRGFATQEAALRLIRGASWTESGTPPPSAGNGSAMRAAPIGLLFYDDLDKLVNAAIKQGKITHLDHRSSAGAVAIAGATAYVLTNTDISSGAMIEHLYNLTKNVDGSVSQAINSLNEWIDLSPHEAATVISKSGNPDNNRTGGWKGISPFVTPSVVWSLYSFLKSPEDYWKTICTSIAVGGDVDTTAAMAGAISGTYVGIENIPSNLLQYLTDQGTWGYKKLKDLAVKTHRLKNNLE